MLTLSVRKLFRFGVQGSVVAASMVGILVLVFFANTLLKIENTEHVFFIFRLIILIASGLVVNVMMKKNVGELSEKHKKSMKKINIYLIVFYVVNESLIAWGAN